MASSLHQRVHSGPSATQTDCRRVGNDWRSKCQALNPPSTSSVAPVMKAASGLAKTATAVGDFLGLPIAAKRRTRLLHLRERAIGRVHIRINGAWLYYIDGDAFRS